MSDLERYGLNWRDKLAPVAQPMTDGYWTPWHVADAEITRLQAANRDLQHWFDDARATAERLEADNEALRGTLEDVAIALKDAGNLTKKMHDLIAAALERQSEGGE